jgi:hypothetical protein
METPGLTEWQCRESRQAPHFPRRPRPPAHQPLWCHRWPVCGPLKLHLHIIEPANACKTDCHVQARQASRDGHDQANVAGAARQLGEAAVPAEAEAGSCGGGNWRRPEPCALRGRCTASISTHPTWGARQGNKQSYKEGNGYGPRRRTHAHACCSATQCDRSALQDDEGEWYPTGTNSTASGGWTPRSL